MSFIQAYQNLPLNIDPIAFTLGPFQVRYYGLMWVAAIVTAYYFLQYQFGKNAICTKSQLYDYFSWAILGAIIGGRLGYVLFYQPTYYLANPLEIILPFRWNEAGIYFVGISGLSYHGGLVGVLATTLWFVKKAQINFWKFADFILPGIALGYMFGRLGNFLNSELYGRVTTSWVGMYFPTAPTLELRHPSQLYEAFGEGLLLFVILVFCRKKQLFENRLLGVYLFGYGLVRFVIEFVRQPDAHLGLLTFNLSMGQWLCLVMMAVGVWIGFNTRVVSGKW